MNQITITVRESLFHFASIDDWMFNAVVMYRAHGHTAQSTICIDQDGKICARGKHFEGARYPATVYAIDEAPFKPAGKSEEVHP